MRSMRRCALCFVAVLATAIAMAQTITKVTVSPSSVVGGASATGTVTLSKKAGQSGVVVQLLWFYDGVTVPPSVTVPPGLTSATFTVSTKPVATPTTSDIEARIGKIGKKASLTVNPPTLSGLTLGATSAKGAAIVTGTVTLATAAPRDGIPVSLSSSSSSATTPSSVTVAAGNTSASFLISTRGVVVSTTARITAKFRTKSESASMTLQPQATLTGTYSGSFFNGNYGNSAFTLGPVSIKISTTGVVSGSSTGYGPGNDGGQAKLSGIAKSNGQVSITATGLHTSVTSAGVWGINSAGNLVMQVENSRDSSDYTYITLTTNGQANPFASNYTGSVVDVYGFGPYIPSFSIGADGSITGTAVPLSDSNAGSYSGSLNSSGVGAVTFTSTAPGYSSYSSEVYAAFTPSGGVIAYLSGGYVISLAKSYAGFHKITFGAGVTAATVEIAVSENGTVTGASILGVTPCRLSGTVSSAGVVNVTATAVNSNIFATYQLTGTLWAVLGGVSGSGAYNGPEHTWTSEGKSCSGLVYAGTYALTSPGYTFSFTIDENGGIYGTSGSGDAVSGSVSADGTLLMIETPPLVSGLLPTAFSGTLSFKSATSVKGQGTFERIDGIVGPWTVTGARV